MPPLSELTQIKYAIPAGLYHRAVFPPGIMPESPKEKVVKWVNEFY